MACIRDEAKEEELKEFVREITTQNGMTKEELLERIPHEYKSSLLSSLLSSLPPLFIIIIIKMILITIKIIKIKKKKKKKK